MEKNFENLTVSELCALRSNNEKQIDKLTKEVNLINIQIFEKEKGVKFNVDYNRFNKIIRIVELYGNEIALFKFIDNKGFPTENKHILTPKDIEIIKEQNNEKK